MTKRTVVFKLAKIAGVIGLILMGVALLLPLLYQKKAAGYLKKQFAEHSDLVLQPSFATSITIWEHFPSITFSFSGLSIVDTSRITPFQVVQVRKASFIVSATNLWKGNIHIREAKLAGVRYHQYVDAKGMKTSFRLKKSPDQNNGVNTLWLGIRHITVDDFQVSTQNIYKANAVSVHVAHADLSANLEGNSFWLRGTAAGQIDSIRNKKLLLFHQKPFAALVNYTYQLQQKQGKLDSSQLYINNDTIFIAGTHTKSDSGTNVAIQFMGDLHLQALLRDVASKKVRKYLRGVTSPSKLHLQGLVFGEITPTKRSRMVLAFNLKNGELYWPKTRSKVKHWQMAGQFDTGEKASPETSTLTMQRLQAQIGEGSIDVRGTLVNFRRPVIDGQVQASLDIPALAQILQLPYASEFKGKIATMLEVKGHLAEVANSYFQQKLMWKGNLTFQDVAFRTTYLTVPCTGIQGEAQFANNVLLLKDIHGQLNGKPVQVQATVKHLLAYVFGYSPVISIDGALEADQLDTKWLTMPDDSVSATQAVQTSGSGELAAKSEQKPAAFIIPHFLQLQAAIQIKEAIILSETIRGLRLYVLHNNDQITLSDMELQARGGTIKGRIWLPNRPDQLDRLQAKLTAHFVSVDPVNLKASLGNTRSGNQIGATTEHGTAATPVKKKLDLAKIDVDLTVDQIPLPGGENLKNFAVQLHKDEDQIQLDDLRFQTTLGGVAEGRGKLRLVSNKVTVPFLQVQVQYDYLDLQNFMRQLAALEVFLPGSPGKNSSTGGVKKAGKAPRSGRDFDVHVQVNAKQLNYEALKGADFRLKANFTRQQATLNELVLQAFDGWFVSQGTVQLIRTPQGLPVQLRVEARDVDLTRLLTVADQLNLDIISSQNIKGTLDCSLQVHTMLDSTFSPELPKTVMYSKTNIRNMELVNVEPIQHALRFFRKERTEHLYFEEIKTHFLLYQNRFITPGLHLNNNITDFGLLGSYTMHGGATLYMDVNVLTAIFGSNKRRIQDITDETPDDNINSKAQHLLVFRENEKYRVKLFTRKDREAAGIAVQNEFQQLLEQQKIDTVFTMMERLSRPLIK
jgi:uncharacterized protein involved in outer membrane biogenesis